MVVVRAVNNIDYDDETKRHLGKELTSFMFVERVISRDFHVPFAAAAEDSQGEKCESMLL
jgi:hypothetical protein